MTLIAGLVGLGRGNTVSVRKNKFFAVAGLTLAGALTLSACGGPAEETPEGGSETGGAAAPAGDLSGSIAGAGASSMQAAQEAWIANFASVQPGVQVTYDPIGSGGGREQFLSGGTVFGGTDSPFKEDEFTAAQERCEGGNAVNFPVYISPIAVIFNLEGVDSLNMRPDTVAKVFSGQITNWNDPEIAEQNPDATLPDLDIIPVNRSDGSGTTENFTDYLSQAAPEVWTYEVGDAWPIPGGQSGDGTSGVVEVVNGAQGTIGYADASQAGDLGTVAVEVAGEYVPYSAEAAAAVVDVSPRSEEAFIPESSIIVELTRTPEEPSYPIVLMSYFMMCDTYTDAAQGEAVKAYAEYITSDEGQEIAAQNAGAAPLSDTLQEEITAILDGVTIG
jgi:phosphate transport system substrate-binding protein